jgi:hypothetical protein
MSPRWRTRRQRWRTPLAAKTALRWRLLQCAFRAADQLADRSAQQQCASDLLALADAAGAPRGWLCRALYAQAVLHVRLGEIGPCLQVVPARRGPGR